MYEVRPWLLIGKYRETTNQQLLDQYRIGALLHLADYVEPSGIVTLCMVIEDGEPIPRATLEQGINFICNQKADGHRVLVACGAGISRSVTFAIAALKEEEDLNLVDGFRVIWLVHPEAMPHPALWQSLNEYYDETASFIDLLDQVRLWEDE